MKYSYLKIEEQDSILTLSIHRPEKLNALSPAVLNELKEFLLQLKSRIQTSPRGMILIGAGEKAFIAGADIQSMATMSVDESEAFSALGQQVSQLFESLSFPVIACVDGYALGGGCEMAMSCDYIFTTEKSIFGQPEVNLGLIPCFGGCIRLLRFIGPGRAKELIFTGRNIDAKEAKSIGLVNEIFATREEMLAAAKKSLQLVSHKSPQAVSICKAVINGTYGISTSAALAIERLGFRQAFAGPEKQEGITAFLEKRAPLF